jgi:lysyl-tRNA synthetase class 2
LFDKKALYWKASRRFLEDKGFAEVHTPTLETTTGGAEANPFLTHHDDFDMDVYLRISVGELWQKRLMAAGFPKTFEIGRVYRNEGSSPEHLQEFTSMEFYWAYANYRDGMEMTKKLYQTIATEAFGRTEFTTRGHTFDLADDWAEIDYRDEVKKQTGIDVLESSEEDMKAKLDELGVKYAGDNRERLMDTLWKYCRKNVAGPAFLIHHPKLVSPLSKSCPDNPELTERFQVILAGSEVGNGFSELNDPREQRARFEIQQKLIESGDEEAMMPEWEFVDMLEHGMPPACGFGFGERLFAFLVDKPIRETQMFPLMKPREDNN